jgi:hypothetical protein
MSDNVIQASFSSGELSPSLFARVDFAKYHAGAATMRNFFVDYRSGASTRTGTEFIRPTKQDQGPVRLVRFQQSTTVTYVLEFGNLYLRFVSDGGSIVEPVFVVESVTKGSSTRVQASVGAPYLEGELVFISGGNIPQLANRYYTIQAVNNAAFNLLDGTLGTPVNSSAWANYTGGATVQRVYTIATPYTSDDLALLKFSQNASVMNITHPHHPPYILTLIDATNWTLVPTTFGATIGSPTITSSISSGGTGTTYYKYTVTSVDQNNQESVPISIAVTGPGPDLRVLAGSNRITWGLVTGASAYNVYGTSPSYFVPPADVGGVGFMGSTLPSVNLFTDTNIAADFSQTPPIHENPFSGIFPQVSSYFQQRLVFGNGGGNDVATFWMSKVGAPYNFDVSNPVQSNDAITGSLVSLEVNEIKSMVPMPSGLLVLTTKGVWQLSGGAGGVATQGGPITPATATATPQAYVGANDVPPILVNYDIIFVQAKGSIVRDLTYNIYANIYTGNDISILSSHLFYGHQILEWAYAEEPFKIVWAIREDGILLSLTLVKEQDMYGWARHDTRGNFQSVASVTEGQFDATYFVVERPHPTNPEKTVQQVERLADRIFTFGAEDAWCVDAGLKTPSVIRDATLFMTIPDADNNVIFTTDEPSFSDGTVGATIRVGGGAAVGTEYINPQAVRAHVVRPITNFLPNDPDGRFDPSPSGSWSIDFPFTVVHGLNHMEGQKVSVLADGGVVNGLTVVDGSITLPQPASKVIVGYGFQAQLQTMYLDLGQEANSIQGKRKKVGALTVRCKDSRGVKAGRTFETVTAIKEMNRATAMGIPISLVTADERIVMDPLWDVPGQVCVQVDDPLPSTVLGVIPEVVIGDSQK